LLGRPEIIIRRITPKTDKQVDIKPLIESITYRLTDPEECIFEILLKITNTSGARPEEVVKELIKENIEIISIVRKEILL